MKINEIAKHDLVVIDFMSGDDQVTGLDLATKDSIEVLQTGTGSIPTIFNIERDSLNGAVFVSHLRHNGVQFDDVSGEGHVPAHLQPKSAMMRDFADEQGFDFTDLPFTTDLNESIGIGNSYTIMKYNAADNRRLPTEVKVVDYLKTPGRRDMVVYQGKDGKPNSLAVNVFKSRIQQAMTEDDADGIVYKVFVNTHGDPEDSWATNGKKYGTADEAEAAAKDLFGRWMAVKYWRVMDADQQTTFAEGP